MSQEKTILRLDAQIRAACPTVSVSIGTFGQSNTVTFITSTGATTDQITAAQAIINSFDWSDSAQTAYDVTQDPTWAALPGQISTAIADIQTYLAITSPTAGQVAAEVKAIDNRLLHILQGLQRVIAKSQ